MIWFMLVVHQGLVRLIFFGGGGGEALAVVTPLWVSLWDLGVFLLTLYQSNTEADALTLI